MRELYQEFVQIIFTCSEENQLLLYQLMNDFGFSRSVAIYALLATGFSSLEAAVLHIVEPSDWQDGARSVMQPPYVPYRGN